MSNEEKKNLTPEELDEVAGGVSVSGLNTILPVSDGAFLRAQRPIDIADIASAASADILGSTPDAAASAKKAEALTDNSRPLFRTK